MMKKTIISLMLGLSIITTQAIHANASLFKAAQNGSLATVEEILKKSTANINKQDAQGNTPLHHAARMGRDSVVKSLLKYGASTAITNNSSGWTPLHTAAYYGKAEAALNIANKCTPEILNKRDNKGRTALGIATNRGNKEIIVLLKAKNALK